MKKHHFLKEVDRKIWADKYSMILKGPDGDSWFVGHEEIVPDQ